MLQLHTVIRKNLLKCQNKSPWNYIKMIIIRRNKLETSGDLWSCWFWPVWSLYHVFPGWEWHGSACEWEVVPWETGRGSRWPPDRRASPIGVLPGDRRSGRILPCARERDVCWGLHVIFLVRFQIWLLKEEFSQEWSVFLLIRTAYVSHCICLKVVVE